MRKLPGIRILNIRVKSFKEIKDFILSQKKSKEMKEENKNV